MTCTILHDDLDLDTVALVDTQHGCMENRHGIYTACILNNINHTPLTNSVEHRLVKASIGESLETLLNIKKSQG